MVLRGFRVELCRESGVNQKSEFIYGGQAGRSARFLCQRFRPYRKSSLGFPKASGFQFIFDIQKLLLQQSHFSIGGVFILHSAFQKFFGCFIINQQFFVIQIFII